MSSQTARRVHRAKASFNWSGVVGRLLRDPLLQGLFLLRTQVTLLPGPPPALSLSEDCRVMLPMRSGPAGDRLEMDTKSQGDFPLDFPALRILTALRLSSACVV